MFGSESHVIKTLMFSVVAIVYTNTKYHVPPTVVVPLPCHTKMLKGYQSVFYNPCAEQWHCFSAVFLWLSSEVRFSSDSGLLTGVEERKLYKGKCSCIGHTQFNLVGNIVCAKLLQRKNGWIMQEVL